MISDAYFEGLQYQENLLNKYYKKSGHEVTILASNFKDIFDYYADNYVKDDTTSDEYINGTRIVKLPFKFNILNKLRKLKDVPKYLEEIKPDVIYVHDIHLNIVDAANYKKKNPNCKIIMDFHADYSNSAKNWLSLNILHKIVRNSYLKKARKYIDKIYYVVPASGLFLHEVYSIPYKDMSLLPLGVDYDLTKEIRNKLNKSELRTKLNIPQDAKVIFTGGKICLLKQTHLIIEALNLLKNSNYHLVIVGTFSENEQEYEKQIKTLASYNKNIHLAGWVSGEKVYEFMHACDIAAFPASQSVLWQQSMSMALPLIIGEEYKTATGKSFCQDIDYLNLKENIYIIRKNQLSASSIVEGIKFYFESEKLETYKENADFVAEKMLDYNKIVQETLNF